MRRSQHGAKSQDLEDQANPDIPEISEFLDPRIKPFQAIVNTKVSTKLVTTTTTTSTTTMTRTTSAATTTTTTTNAGSQLTQVVVYVSEQTDAGTDCNVSLKLKYRGTEESSQSNILNRDAT